MNIRSFKLVLIGVLAICHSASASECFGYSGPGGACYSGLGGGLYSGPGGGVYSGPPSNNPNDYHGPWSPYITGAADDSWLRNNCPNR